LIFLTGVIFVFIPFYQKEKEKRKEKKKKKKGLFPLVVSLPFGGSTLEHAWLEGHKTLPTMPDVDMAERKEEAADPEKTGEDGVDEGDEKALPDFAIARWIFLLRRESDDVSADERSQARESLWERIRQDHALALYQRVCVKELGWDEDAAFVKEAEEFIAAQETGFADKIQEAEETLGKTDVRDLMHKRADFYAEIGDVDRALAEYAEVLKNTTEDGRKIDVSLTIVRLGMFWRDSAVVQKGFEDTRGLVEKAGDWDRRNRLKVYDALWTASHARDFKKSSKLLLETLSTFAATELLEFKDFVWYACVIACPALDRVSLKTKIMESPEVAQGISNHPALKQLMHSLHSCQYKDFFVALAEVTDLLKKDLFLSPHAAYFCKEMRVRAYNQLLQSYRSVQLSQVAAQFGVTEEFVDLELSRFIASGRLAAKIDKVGGAVETNRAGQKVAQYNELLRQGDVLLNRVQQLSRVINL
jgi:26S proteasome regulatory subunit N7